MDQIIGFGALAIVYCVVKFYKDRKQKKKLTIAIDNINQEMMGLSEEIKLSNLDDKDAILLRELYDLKVTKATFQEREKHLWG